MKVLFSNETFEVFFPWDHCEQVVVDIKVPLVEGTEGYHTFSCKTVKGQVRIAFKVWSDRYRDLVRPHLHLIYGDESTQEQKARGWMTHQQVLAILNQDMWV